MLYMRFNLFSIAVFIILFGLTTEPAEADPLSAVATPIQPASLLNQAQSLSPAGVDTSTTAEHLLYELAPAAKKQRNLDGALAAGLSVLILIDGIEATRYEGSYPPAQPDESLNFLFSGFLAVASVGIFSIPSRAESAAEEIRKVSDIQEREEKALAHLITFSERARKLRMNVGGMLLTIGLLGLRSINEDRSKGYDVEPGMGFIFSAFTGTGLWRLIKRYPAEKLMEKYERAQLDPDMTFDLGPALIAGERRTIPGISLRLSFGRYGPSR